MDGNRVLLLVGLLMFPCVLPHPQCLDYRPPFSVEGGLKFCEEYRNFGCCDRDADKQIKKQVKSLAPVLRKEGLRKCKRYLKTLLCQRCSPYAAHLYKSESTGQAQPIPGLCEGYCNNFYKKCHTIIRHLTSNDVILQSLSSQESFCQQVSLTDKRYCYNDILQNTDLNREISREQVTNEGCLCLEPFDSGLDNPLNLLSPPDGTGRIFITEQKGLVHVYDRNRVRAGQPFLDIQDAVFAMPNRVGECGLLGIAFHPKYSRNKRFFIHYTSIVNGELFNTLSEFTVLDRNPMKANRSSERILLQIRQPFMNHNGGSVLFGADSYLYLFIGDGGGAWDKFNNTQNTRLLLGKSLRIDVDQSDAVRKLPYRIPADNPFINNRRYRPEIYALGLRNPWRCDMDEGDPKTGERFSNWRIGNEHRHNFTLNLTGANRGRILCGDVGQRTFEEVNVIKRGANYGWNIREGDHCSERRLDTCQSIPKEEFEAPIHAYPHTDDLCSITGGHVYRGCLSPNLQGFYIYGDYCEGKLFRLKEDTKSGKWKNKEINMCGDDICFNGLVGKYKRNILSFGEDHRGEIYILTTDNPILGSGNGTIYRIMDPRMRGDPSSCWHGHIL